MKQPDFVFCSISILTFLDIAWIGSVIIREVCWKSQFENEYMDTTILREQPKYALESSGPRVYEGVLQAVC